MLLLVVGSKVKLIMYLGQSSDNETQKRLRELELKVFSHRHSNKTIFGVNLATNYIMGYNFFKRLYNLKLLATRGSII